MEARDFGENCCKTEKSVADKKYMPTFIKCLSLIR